MSDQIRAGLEAYAAGDLSGALTAWSQVEPDDPDFSHVRDYLAFVQQAEPSTFREVFGDFDPPAAAGPPVAPLSFPPEPDAAALEETLEIDVPPSLSEVREGLSQEWDEMPTAESEPVVLPESTATEPPGVLDERAPQADPAAALPAVAEPALDDLAPEPVSAAAEFASPEAPELDIDFDLDVSPPAPAGAAPEPGEVPPAAVDSSPAIGSETPPLDLSPPPATRTVPREPAAAPTAASEFLEERTLEDPIPLGASDSSAVALPAASPSAPPRTTSPPPPALDPTSPGTAAPESSEPEFAGPLLGAPPRAVIPPAEYTAPPPPAGHNEDAFDLVERVDSASAAQKEEAATADPGSLPELERRLNELSELDDLNGALDVAKRILAHDPEHQAARAAQARSRDVLMKMSVSKIGDLGAVPTVLCPPDQVIWLDLDHRSGFILSQVDGVSTYQDIMEIAGMDPLECATILAELVAEGVIGEAR